MTIKDAKKLKAGDKVIVKQYTEHFTVAKIDGSLSNDKQVYFWTDTGELFGHKEVEKIVR